MTCGFNILKNWNENLSARNKMHELGISFLPNYAKRLLNRFFPVQYPLIGDLRKSWDVFKTVQFIDTHIPKGDSILDLGAYCSEVLLCLDKIGYTNLTGIDLNLLIITASKNNHITYLCEDFMSYRPIGEKHTVITAISVIEHNYSPKQLFQMLSESLRPGGYFIASMDYWPEKINTEGVRFFDMDWLIFSHVDIQNLIDISYEYGFEPVGDCDFSAVDRPICCAGKYYTFGWLALQKVR